MNKVYLIGNAHLDPVWLWRKSEGLSEILSTFRSALDRMEEFPSYIFTCACAGYYQWAEQVDPAMFGEIQARVKEGRWSVVGGYWVQPDCNLPSGEAFARHALYSQLYFREKLGVTATVGYHVDSFGHNGMLPQLLRKSGMKRYVFMRGGEQGEPGFPDLFRWRSPDGSQILAHKIYGSYAENWGYPPDVEPCGAKVGELRERAEKNAIPYMSFYGVGNHGGGPTIRGLRVLEAITAQDREVCFASTEDYFRDVEATGLPESLPVVEGSLIHHASGCYAANAAIKAANRRAENALVKAEKYDLLAQRLLGCGGAGEALRLAWEKVLFNQFHDILAGCCIREAYVDALDSFSAACDAAAEITDLALHRIAWNVRTTRVLDRSPCQKNGWILWEKEGEGAPLVVFNPHSFPLREVVQVNTTVDGVADADGNPVLCQNIRGSQTNEADVTNTIFTAKLPAFGYAVYYIFKEHSFAFDTPAAVRAEGCSLENESLRLTIDAHTGCVTSLLDKETGREWAAGPMARALVIDDYACDTWAHGRFVFDDKVGVFTDAQVRVLENGPVRAAIRVISRYQNSTLRQDFMLSAGAREVKIKCKIDFHEKLKLVKLCFPVRVDMPAVDCSIPYGFERRELDGLEQPSQQWIRVQESGCDGLGLCNDGKYSFSTGRCAGGVEIRMVLARGAIYADHFGKRDDLVEYQDQGEQYFSYTLVPGANTAEVVRRAAVLNMSPDVLLETHHKGRLEPCWEGVALSAENVSLAAAKIAEERDAVILRLVETAGREVHTEIDAAFLGRRLQVHMGPQEIKTLRVHPGSGHVSEVLFTELPPEGR